MPAAFLLPIPSAAEHVVLEADVEAAVLISGFWVPADLRPPLGELIEVTACATTEDGFVAPLG